MLIMPTIIALDTSFSMQRIIPGRNEENTLTYHQLAIKGIIHLLDYLSSTTKLEYVSFLTFNNSCEVKVDFTRDYDCIKQIIKKIDVGDKLCLLSLMRTVGNIFSTTWGTQSYCQVVVFTDCGLGFGQNSIPNFLEKYEDNETDANQWLRSVKEPKWNFICMGIHSDSYFTHSIVVYQQLLNVVGMKGELFAPHFLKDNSSDNSENITNDNIRNNISNTYKSELGRTVMVELVEKLCEESYKPYEVLLKCGGYFRLESQIILWPAPIPFCATESYKYNLHMNIASELEICGYLSLNDIGIPACISRHLVVPKTEHDKLFRKPLCKSGNSIKLNDKSHSMDVTQSNYQYGKLEHEIKEFYNSDNSNLDDSSSVKAIDLDNNKHISAWGAINNYQSSASLCFLLHGALSLENLAALVQLNDNCIMAPGGDIIPWIGEIEMLGLCEDLMPGESFSFPVKADKRSYTQSSVVWINRVSLQSDVQKVLRHAKKMPEKTQHFYKELNRIRRAALSIGFHSLLEAMASLFEKESINLAALNSNPECSLQLQHVSIELRKPSNKDIKASIIPLHTVNPNNSLSSSKILPQSGASTGS